MEPHQAIPGLGTLCISLSALQPGPVGHNLVLKDLQSHDLHLVPSHDFHSSPILGTERAEGEWISWVCTKTVLGRGREPGSCPRL